ncbi:MAG TPA: acyl-CoA dehydrogenase family protein, partial [Candidatus Binataceae bacterium]|nr:acyl-CoA dehydrogenase family protein [Candidatus Binataceae bacterium]
MDFNFTPEDEAFRKEFRAWLDKNAPKDGKLAEADTFAEDDDSDWGRRVAWCKRLNEGGWLGIDWPKEYGGRGASILQSIVYHQELGRARAPLPYIGSGLSLIGPTLMHWGTEEQKKRFIPKILSCEDIWCQGYSEPNSGSDLASLQTRAIEDGDDFVVNGQKIWTSSAQHADWIFLLVRTDVDAPKHKGISYLLVDMHSPGITVRPLVQMTGAKGFNEVFFDDVRVPKKNIVGEKNQ